jgi:hypothetical protein
VRGSDGAAPHTFVAAAAVAVRFGAQPNDGDLKAIIATSMEGKAGRERRVKPSIGRAWTSCKRLKLCAQPYPHVSFELV